MNLKLLKNRNFALLILGNSVSLLGSNMQQFALSLYVLSITKSATLFAAIVAISVIPRLVVSPVAGVFGDWFDRKKSIVTLDLLNGILIGAYAIYYLINGSLSIPSIFLLVILLEITEIFFGSAMAAVIPSMIEKEHLFEANSIKSVFDSLGGIIAPLLASVLFGAFGLLPILIVNGLSFIASALSELTIAIPKSHAAPQKIDLVNFKKDLSEGIKIIKEQKVIRVIIGLGMILNFSLSPLLSIGLTYIIKDTLNGTPLQFGLGGSILAFSLLLSPMLFGSYAQKINVGRVTIASFLIVGALVGLMSIATTQAMIGFFPTNLVPYIMIMAVSFLIGMAISIANISIGTLFGTLVPREFMGRTAAVMNMGLTIAMPIGQLGIGIALDFLTPAPIVLTVAIIIVGSVIYYARPLLSATRPAVETTAAPTAENLQTKDSGDVKLEASS